MNISIIKNIKKSILKKTNIRKEKRKIYQDQISEYDVAVYFFGDNSHIYQIEQWLPIFKKLSEKCRFCIVVRNKAVHESLKDNMTTFFCRTIDDLLEFYEEKNIKCILYVNNKFKNFQSLITNKALHVHINHGESEKASMHSNQSKAYDYVFCVGDAAIDRYRNKILKFHPSKYVKIGRPQLDHVKPFPFSQKTKSKIILYAPTWAATHGAMNYSSVAEYGEKIVRSILSSNDYYLIYKPHPSTGTSCDNEKHKNNLIKQIIQESNNALDASNIEINSLLPIADLAIFDNSSVTIDFLKYNKPFLSTNMYKNKSDIPPFTKASKILSHDDYEEIIKTINHEISKDTYKPERIKMKNYYLGKLKQGESTDIFIRKILSTIEERDSYLVTPLSER